jgi:hypothetical protein
MKVQVAIKVPSKQSGDLPVLSVVFSANDTVADVKDRVAAAHGVPFPDQDLVFAGSTLEDGKRLADCGVKDGDSLDFVVRTSETTLAQQISELLKASTVSASELDHLYVLKHGVSTQGALKMLGLSTSLQEFLTSQKIFTVSDGGRKVCLACINENQLINVQVAIEPIILENKCWADEDDDANNSYTTYDVAVGLNETAAALAARAASTAGIPRAFSDLKLTCQGKPLEPNMPLATCREVKQGVSIQLNACTSDAILVEQLLQLLGQYSEMTVEELGLMFTCTYGVGIQRVLRSIARSNCRSTLTQFLRGRPEFDVSRDCVARKSPGALTRLPPAKTPSSIHQRCLEVHDQISTRQFQTGTLQAVTKIVTVLMQATFLNIHHYVTGGSVGKGTAIEGGSAEAELTIFLAGLTVAEFKGKLCELLDLVAAFLREKISAANLQGLQVTEVQNDAVHLTMNELPSVRVCLSPTFSTHGDALDQIQLEASPSEVVHSAFLAEQEVRFIKKQPEAVKITARLLKHWRDSCSWSSDQTRPTDRFLDLLAIHASMSQPPRDGKPYNQGEALELIRSLMIRLDTLKVVWPIPFHGKCKIPSSLLDQRPLLMDPVNPFVNLANPSKFDPSETMSHASKSTQHLL